jgi:hypothetical protein
MTIRGTANATLAISDAPVTFDLDQDEATLIAAFEGETYVQIKDVEDLGEQGDTFNEVTFNAIDANRVRRIKGLRDGGVTSLVVGHSPEDAGQQQLLVASKDTNFSRSGYAFRLQLDDNPDPSPGDGTPTTFYFVANVGGFRQAAGGADNVIRRTYPVWVNSDFIEVAADEGV